MTRVRFVAVLVMGVLTLLSAGCGDLGGGMIAEIDELGFDSDKLCDPDGGGFGRHRILNLQVGEARELIIPGLEAVDPVEDDIVALEPGGPDRVLVYAQYPGYQRMRIHRRGEKDLIVELTVWRAGPGPADLDKIYHLLPNLGESITRKRIGDEIVLVGSVFTFDDYRLVESLAMRFPAIRCEVRINPNALKLLNEGDQLAEYLGEE
jgi:hypothetical protein